VETVGNLTGFGIDRPMARSHQAGRFADPAPFYKGAGVGDTNDAHLVAGSPERGCLHGERFPFRPECQQPRAAIRFSKVLTHTLARPEEDTCSIEAERPKRVASQVEELRLGGATRLKSVTKVFEVAIDPAPSGRPLEAGRAGGGKPPWCPWVPPRSLGERDEGTQGRQGCSRCGKRCARHLGGCSKVPDALPLGRLRQRPREPREGEAVLGRAHCQVTEAVDDILTDATRLQLKPLGVQGVPANVVAKFLQTINLIGNAPRGGPTGPLVKEPGHAHRIPARQDKAAPTGCPNLLEWRHNASAVPVTAHSLTGGRSRLLRRKALYK